MLNKSLTSNREYHLSSMPGRRTKKNQDLKPDECTQWESLPVGSGRKPSEATRKWYPKESTGQQMLTRSALSSGRTMEYNKWPARQREGSTKESQSRCRSFTGKVRSRGWEFGDWPLAQKLTETTGRIALRYRPAWASQRVECVQKGQETWDRTLENAVL